MNKFTVACCWDGSDYYSPCYIDRLYNSVKRNTSISFDFVVYVGPQADEIRLKMINSSIKVWQTNRPYWWPAMEFWAERPPLIETETILYLDLDIVIVNNIDEIINFPSEHAYMKDYPADICPKGKEHDGNASVVLIRNGAGRRIWEEYVKAGMPQWDVLNPPPNRIFPLAVQGILNDYKIQHDLFPQSWVPSYKLDVLKNGLSDDCKIVSFHGRPKPHECHETWIKENWK